jgi:hypothetical protein
MEGKGTPLWEGITNKTWKGNSPIIRGYPPAKRSGSDLLPGTSKRPNSGDTGKTQADQKANQAALQCLDALPAPILVLFLS